MLLVLQDQVHIGHCCTLQFLLFICGATIVSLTLFAPGASSGTILELCSFSYSKFQKSKLDSNFQPLGWFLNLNLIFMLFHAV
jgi:hypothetical protein